MTDITDHLNQLNLKLQGEDKLLPKMYEAIESFQRKLTMFSAHLSTKNLRHFPVLTKMVTEVDFLVILQAGFRGNDGDLSEEFHSRFQECHSKTAMFQFTLNSFTFKPESLGEFMPDESIAEAELELIELQNDVFISSSKKVNRQDCIGVWKAISTFPHYPQILKMAKW